MAMVCITIEKEVLEPLLPNCVSIGLFEGKAWLIIGQFQNSACSHPRFISPIPGIADFNEINLRTYVTDGSIPGITFFDIRANNRVQVILNRMVGLAYQKARVTRKVSEGEKYASESKGEYVVDIEYTKGEHLKDKNNNCAL